MPTAPFPWRPLGELLCEKQVITRGQLQDALRDQQRTGRRLGEIVLARGWASELELTAALAEQHGVDVSFGEVEPPPRAAGRRPVAAGLAPEGVEPDGALRQAEPDSTGEWTWKPLGRVLIERGLLDDIRLQQALAEQRATGERLGRILVQRKVISADALARALAEQHGFALTAPSALRVVPAAVERADERGDERFRVVEDGRRGRASRVSQSLLDAIDMAFDALYERKPRTLRIIRVSGSERELVWQYRQSDMG
ncbi:MAG TPA: hypothetical protein VFA44_16655 [Gaiellaceae bacterium]|nr:hypothetical protein [Gaiellaceae bacterium]